MWALVPTHPTVIEAPSLEVANAAADVPPPAPLDVKAFETPVWTIAAAPQPPAPPPPPPPAPPPLKLLLIGIIKEAEVYKAVIYDPDTNKLFVVASGQDAAGHTIDRVAADAITIKDGSLVRTLPEDGRRRHDPGPVLAQRSVFLGGARCPGRAGHQRCTRGRAADLAGGPARAGG